MASEEGASSLPVRHNLPQIPVRTQQCGRTALSKSGNTADGESELRLLSEDDISPVKPMESATPTVSPNPNPPVQPTAAPHQLTPIKLRIRRSVCDGKTEVSSEEIIEGVPASKPPEPTPAPMPTPPAPPKRARTKGELKKQLQEKRGKRSGLLPVLPPPPEPNDQVRGSIGGHDIYLNFSLNVACVDCSQT
jgi:hypothetical protein